MKEDKYAALRAAAKAYNKAYAELWPAGLEIYTMAQVARELGVSYMAIHNRAIDGRLPAPISVGRSRLYTPDDLERIRRYFAKLARLGQSE